MVSKKRKNFWFHWFLNFFLISFYLFLVWSLLFSPCSALQHPILTVPPHSQATPCSLQSTSLAWSVPSLLLHPVIHPDMFLSLTSHPLSQFFSGLFVLSWILFHLAHWLYDHISGKQRDPARDCDPWPPRSYGVKIITLCALATCFACFLSPTHVSVI